MKKAIMSFILLCSCFAFPARGQDFHEEITTHIGLGVSFSPLSLFTNGSDFISISQYPTPALYIPMKVGKSFRFEPMIWYTRASSGKEYKITTTLWTLGAGILYLFPAEKENSKVEFSVGTRFTINIGGETRTGPFLDESDSYTIFSMGIVNGAEYYFTPRFSLGGELMLFYKKNTDTSASLVSIGTAFFIRWFFN